MKKLLIVQPALAQYRVNVYNELSKSFNLKVVATGFLDEGNFDKSSIDFSFVNLKEFKILNLRFQKNLMGVFLNERPELLFLPFVPYYPAWLFLIIFARLFGCKVFLHGHGLYKYKKLGLLKKSLYKIFFLITNRYVCYTKFSREKLIQFKFESEKLVVVENTLTLKAVIPSDQKKNLSDEILFIGRIRQGSQLEKLLISVKEVNSSGKKCVLHIIGDGQEFSFFKSRFNQDYYKWYGGIYDESAIAEISKKCKLACYPGDVGLSVVHFFSLSLPIVTHVDFYPGFKGGPEASYITDGYNGFLISRSISSLELANKLVEILSLPEKQIQDLQKNSFETYLKLNKPSYAEKLTRVFLEEI